MFTSRVIKILWILSPIILSWGEYSLNKSGFINWEKVLAVFGSEKRKRDMLVLNEAFRLDLMPPLDEIKSGRATIKTIEKEIRVKFQ